MEKFIPSGRPGLEVFHQLQKAKNVKWAVLDTGELGIWKTDLTYLRGQGDKKWWIPIWGSYIETPDAKIIVDCGQDPNDPEIKKRISYQGIAFGPIKQTREQTYEYQLDKIGVKAEDINFVLYTHMHFDHTGATKLFTKAKHVPQMAELRYAAKPDPFMLISYCPSEYIPLLDLFEPIEGDAMIVAGVYCFSTPGHTPGTMSILVMPTKGQAFMLPGDCCYLRENFNDEWPPGFVYEPETFVASIRRQKRIVKELNATHWPSHDPEVFKELKKAPAWQYSDY